MGAYVYIVKCRDGRYYTGSTRASLGRRVAEHNDGTFGGYTKSRRPVELVFSQEFDRITDGISAERQLKGWTRAKKEALIRGDMEALQRLARNRGESPRPSSFDKLRMRKLGMRKLRMRCGVCCLRHHQSSSS